MDLNPRTQRRLDRIKEKVDILALLEEFGFNVRTDMDREQQFPCRMHGSGQDNKPSARVYPETHSWYCWGCQKSRDAVSTVREQTGAGFMDALKWLETKFALPTMGYQDGDAYERKATPGEVITKSLRHDRTFADTAKVVSTLLDAVTEERILPLDRTTAFWEAFDRVVFLVNGKGQSLPEPQGQAALEKVRSRVKAEMAGA